MIILCTCYGVSSRPGHLESCPLAMIAAVAAKGTPTFSPDPKAPPPAPQCMEGMPCFDSLEEAQVKEKTATPDTRGLRDRLNAPEAMIARLTTDLANARAAIRAHEERNAALLRRGDRLEERNERHARNYELLKAECQALYETLDSRRKDLARAEENVRSLQGECARLNKQNTDTERRMKDASMLLKGSCTCGKPADSGTHYFGNGQPCEAPSTAKKSCALFNCGRPAADGYAVCALHSGADK